MTAGRRLISVPQLQRALGQAGSAALGLALMLALATCGRLERAPLAQQTHVQTARVLEHDTVAATDVESRSTRALVGALTLSPVVFITATTAVERDFGEGRIHHYVVVYDDGSTGEILSHNIVEVGDCLDVRRDVEDQVISVMRVADDQCAHMPMSGGEK